MKFRGQILRTLLRTIKLLHINWCPWECRTIHSEVCVRKKRTESWEVQWVTIDLLRTEYFKLWLFQSRFIRPPRKNILDRILPDQSIWTQILPHRKYTIYQSFMMFSGNNRLFWIQTKPIKTRCGQNTGVFYLKSNSSTYRINVTVKKLTSCTREWLPPCSCCDLCIVLKLYEDLHSYAHCNCSTARFLNFVHYLVLRGPIREYSFSAGPIYVSLHLFLWGREKDPLRKFVFFSK